MQAEQHDRSGACDTAAPLAGPGLVDAGADEALDRLVRLASRVLDAPISAILLRDGDDLVYKSWTGLPASFAGRRRFRLRDSAFVGFLDRPEPLVVEDAGADDRVRVAAAASELEVRGLIAVPLQGRCGGVTGAFVVMDRRPRRWRGPELQTLADLAASAVTEVEWRVAAAERARSAETLRRSEERFRLMVEGGEQVFFYTHDVEGRFEYVSPSVQAVLGYTPQELVGRPYTVLLAGDPSDDTVVALTAETLHGEGQRSTYTALTRHRDGRIVVVELVESAIRDADGGVVVGVQGFARDITLRRRAEEELRVRTAHLEHLIENAPEAIVLLDPDEHVLRVNREFIRVFGYAAEQAVGRHIAELIVRDADRAEADRFGDRVARGETVSARAIRRRRDGSTLHVSILATPVVVEGAPTAIFGIYRDITDQVRAEETVRRSAEHFRALIEGSSDLIQILEADGSVRYATPSLRRILGWEPEEVVGRSVLDLVHRDDRRQVVAAFAAATGPGGISDPVEVRTRRRDGGWRIFEGVARNLLDDPAVGGIVVTSRDVTSRVEAAAELQRNAVILASIPDAVMVTDTDGVVLYWNEGAERLFGWTADEVVGGSIVGRLPPAIRRRFRGELARVLAGERIHGEYEHVRKDGSRILADSRISLIRDAAGEPRAVLRITRDITEQRLMGRVLDQIPEAVVCLDAENRIVACNAAAERIFGYTAAELIGQPIDMLAPEPEERSRIDRIVGQTRRHGGWSGEVVRRRKDGTHFPAQLTTGVVRDLEGRVIGQAGLVRDLTEEKLREAQLRRAERMSSLGTLLGGLTHELNNPLTSIKSFAQLLLLDDRSAEDREGLEVIRQEADRAAKLVADLRLLARQTQEIAAPSSEAIDLNDLVRGVLASRGEAMQAAGIVVCDDLTEELLPVWGARDRLEEAIRQLVLNAEQAVLAGGDSRRLTVQTRARIGGVWLTVCDTGAGIDPMHLEHIFDPFWTTKDPGEGTGLGLSMVHAVVTEHGGSIRVESDARTGTCFVVELPWSAGARPAAAGAESQALRILLVDDEAPIRRSLARFLERRGHRVDAVRHGGEALERIEAGGRYEVIVSDLRMPGLGGGELFDTLAARGDGTERRMVLVTGSPCHGEVDRALADAGVPIVVKPFQLDEIAELIEQVAERP